MSFWRSDREALADIDSLLRENPRRSVKWIAMRLGVERSTIYRRVKRATDMRFSEYVLSRNFLQQK